jgi:hypothetical protein
MTLTSHSQKLLIFLKVVGCDYQSLSPLHRQWKNSNTVQGVTMQVIREIFPDMDEITGAINLNNHAFALPVDETKMVEELVKEGSYDWNNPDIASKNFPVRSNRKTITDIFLFCFYKIMLSEEVVAEMNKVDCAPASIWTLLSLGASLPVLQKKFPIVALGSVSGLGYYARVGFIGRFDMQRDVGLDYLNSSWNKQCRFLAERK